MYPSCGSKYSDGYHVFGTSKGKDVVVDNKRYNMQSRREGIGVVVGDVEDGLEFLDSKGGKSLRRGNKSNIINAQEKAHLEVLSCKQLSIMGIVRANNTLAIGIPL